MNNKFFLYVRKSTDVEDKQVLSIEAQITELRAFAKQNNLSIVDVFIEKQSAKIPGRPIFNEMIKRIEKDNFGDWVHFYYSKNSFLGKANTKIARDFEPALGEPRRARRASVSIPFRASRGRINRQNS